MPSVFQQDDLGYWAKADPDSELDYSVVSWLEGLLFLDVAWSIAPAVAGVPYDEFINPVPVTIDGVEYAAGQVAGVWVKDLTVGVVYTLTAHATFTGNRIDDRSFRLRCVER
jgi:hypothetical protein